MPIKGHVIPNTPIAVNIWNVRDYPHAKLFFLTHFHPDHLQGLTSSWTYPIYASAISCELLENIIGISRAHLHCLQIGQPKNIYVDLESTEQLIVSVFDANHCPGSIMIFFQGYFGNILYTGDFRYKPDFLNFSLLPNVDILYLDNKYCCEDCNFPSQTDAIDNILQLVHSCLQKSQRIYVGIDDLGKEDLLLKLAFETHTQIWINEKKKKTILKILKISDIIASEKFEAKFFVVPANQINGFNLEKWNTEMTTCAILPSARYCGFKFQPYSKYDNIHIEPLSNHSSFVELLAFVEKINPHCVIPIIDETLKGIFGIDISNRADMSVFDRFLNHGRLLKIVIPENVKKTMDLWSENTKVLFSKKRRISPFSRSQYEKMLQLNESESNSSDEENLSHFDFIGESEDNISYNHLHSNNYLWEVIHIPANGHRKLLHID